MTCINAAAWSATMIPTETSMKRCSAITYAMRWIKRAIKRALVAA
jgi:hypothetical protein